MKPYERNTYFFVNLPEPAIEAMIGHTVEGSIDKAFKCYDDSYLIKLPINAEVPKVFSHLKSYSHKEMVIERSKRESGRPDPAIVNNNIFVRIGNFFKNLF